MKKSFGIRGTLEPKSAFKDMNLVIPLDDGFEVNIKDGIFEIAFDKRYDKERALNLANTFIAHWSIRNNIKATALFNQTWVQKPSGGKFVNIEFHENIKATDRVQTYRQTIIAQFKARITKISDSYSFTNDLSTVKKASKDKTLHLALKYLHEESIDSDKPMYGIHKALEQIINTMPGKNVKEKRENLADLLGQNKEYIDDVMESIQPERHSEKWIEKGGTKKKITDEEIKKRTIAILNAYEASLD